MTDMSNFVKVMGETPESKVWDYLIHNRGLFDYSLTDISEGSGVAWNTLKTIFPEMIKQGVVKETRKVGRATLYQLNENHPQAMFMVGLHKTISMVFVHGGQFRLKYQIFRDHKQMVPLDIPINPQAVGMKV